MAELPRLCRSDFRYLITSNEAMDSTDGNTWRNRLRPVGSLHPYMIQVGDSGYDLVRVFVFDDVLAVFF